MEAKGEGAAERWSEVISWPDDDRIVHIKRDRWIPIEQANRAIRRLRLLLIGEPSLRPLGVLVWGPPNSGKSAILAQFLRKHAPEPTFDEEEGLLRPAVLSINCPTEADETRLLDEIAAQMDPFLTWPGRLVGGSVRAVHREVYRGLEDIRPRALAFDDLNNFAVFKGYSQTKTLNAIRRLTSVNRVPVICLGTEAVHSVIRTDRQLLERFAFIELKPLNRDTEFVVFVRKFASTLPLRRPIEISDRMLDTIFEASEGIVGRIVVHMKEAAILAVQQGGEELTSEILNAEEVLEALEAARLAKQLKRRGRAS